MNNTRNVKYLQLLIIVLITFALSLVFISSLIIDHLSLSTSLFLFISLGFLVGVKITGTIFSIFIYKKITKEYDEQYSRYNDKIILENKKRETSALLMSMLWLPSFLQIFVTLNSYFKSGLTKKQRDHAMKEINVKNVPSILKQKNVAKKVQEIDIAKMIIKDVLEMAKKKIDFERNCYLYILQILREESIKFETNYDQKEIYYLGMNL